MCFSGTHQIIINFAMHQADKENNKIIKRIPESLRSMKNLNTGSLSLFFNGDNIFLNHVGVLKQNNFENAK